ncbi:MAG: hypothetical protein PQJ59_15125 [Spirochaetales bacterium]|nr:hypothetical protein [Spirochaetales bacterium]
MNIKTQLFFLLMIITACLFPLFGEEEEIDERIILTYHSKGDQTFSIEAGLFIPLFTIDPTPDGDGDSGDTINSLSGQMNLGGSGFLSYMGYLNSKFRLGGEFGGMFSSSLNENNFYMVPIMVKSAYDINISTYFTIPLYLSAGVTLNSYDDYFSVDPIIKPGIGLNWNYDSEWSFILKYDLWVIPEIAREDNQSRIGVFSDVRFGVEYHF